MRRHWATGSGRAMVLAGLALAASSAWADTVITQEVESSGSKGQMVIRIRGHQVRSDLAEPVSLIYDADTGETIYLQHRPRLYHRVTAAQSRALAGKLRESLGDTAGRLEATGQKKEISGYQAELFHWTYGTFKLHLWVAKDFPRAASLRGLMGGEEASVLMPTFQALPGLFIRTEMEAGGQKLNYTILSVKDEVVPGALFAIPPGYKEVPFGVPGEQAAPEPTPPATPPPAVPAAAP